MSSARSICAAGARGGASLTRGVHGSRSACMDARLRHRASETNDGAVFDALMQAFRLTMREAEVLYWVAKGKTNRDVADILAMSPRTVTKHMEHILQKLGVVTRAGSAG